MVERSKARLKATVVWARELLRVQEASSLKKGDLKQKKELIQEDMLKMEVTYLFCWHMLSTIVPMFNILNPKSLTITC